MQVKSQLKVEETVRANMFGLTRLEVRFYMVYQPNDDLLKSATN